ncbi:cell division protein FtsZ, partial [Limosilactobacillus fermentum]
MINENVEGVDFIVANTDLQALRRVPTPRAELRLGPKLTLGAWGAGVKTREVGAEAAQESESDITEALEGA